MLAIPFQTCPAHATLGAIVSAEESVTPGGDRLNSVKMGDKHAAHRILLQYLGMSARRQRARPYRALQWRDHAVARALRQHGCCRLQIADRRRQVHLTRRRPHTDVRLNAGAPTSVVLSAAL